MTDVKQSIAIASPGISGGEGLAGWPWPGAAPVYPVFWLRLVRPAKGDVMTTSILVTGGTGTLGRPVAQRLRDAGASVTVLSRTSIVMHPGLPRARSSRSPRPR